MNQFLARCAYAALQIIFSTWIIASASASEPAKVKLGYFPAMVDTPVFIAASQGIFKKNNLDVEMILFSSGPTLIGSLLSGSTPFVDVGALLTFPQFSRGHDVRGLSNFWQGSIYTVIVRNSVPTPNAGRPYPAPVLDLKGKKLGVVALGSATSAFAETLLKDAGLRPGDDVTIVPSGPIATGIAALIGGSIDAYISYAPMNQLLDARYPGSYKLILDKDHFPPALKVSLYPHIATTQQFISANPAIVDAACKAIHEALVWMSDPANFDAAVAGMEQWLPGNPAGVLSAALKAELPAIIGSDRATLGKITQEQIKNANDQLLSLKYTTQAVPYDKYVHRSKECN
jgi:NitT/TauT family transport system substrate-binding protein